MILVVDNQRIYNYEYPIDPPPIASNSLQFIDIEFRLSEEWNDFICTAQFVQERGEDEPKYIASKVLYNNHVTLPDGLIPGNVEISLFGYKAGEAERGTTIPYIQSIIRSGFTSTEETPIPPTPDLYAQLLEKFRQQAVSDEVIAEAVKDYLEKHPIEAEIPIATTEKLGGIIVGEGLSIEDSGKLKVDVAEAVEQDNTKPITSAAVYTEVGNINALLSTI